MMCQKSPESPEPCPFLHPRAWFEEREDGRRAGGQLTPPPESRIPIGYEMLQLLTNGHRILEVRRWAAEHGLCASLEREHAVEGQHALVLRGIGVHEAMDGADLLLAEMATFMPDRIEHAGEGIVIPQSTATRLIGQKGQLIRMLARDLRVRLHIRPHPSMAETQVLESFGPTSALNAACDQLQLLCIDPSPAERQLNVENRQLVDIFVDNSNLSICSQSLPDGSRDFLVRLNITKLAREMQGVRSVRRRVVAGSKPPREHGIWRSWENAGFEVNLSHRDPEHNREQNVDEFLVAQALMHVVSNPPGVLIVGTGDGNTRNQLPGTTAANFRNLVTAAIERGWFVELWAWRAGCHHCYFEMEDQFPGSFKVCLLDGLREFVTFRRENLAVGAQDIAVDDDLCAVCLGAPASHRYNPCGHQALCQACADLITPHCHDETSLSWCALCRIPFDSITQSARI